MLLPLIGCGPSVRVDTKAVTELNDVRAQAPEAFTRPCHAPVDLVGELSAGAVEKLWAQDRIALVACRDEHDLYVGFIRRRDAGLAGK